MEAEGIESRIYDKTFAVSEGLDRSAGILLDLVRFYPGAPTAAATDRIKRRRRAAILLHQKYLFLLTLGGGGNRASANRDSNALSGPLGSAPRRPNSCHGGPRWGALATRCSQRRSRTIPIWLKTNWTHAPRTPARRSMEFDEYAGAHIPPRRSTLTLVCLFCFRPFTFSLPRRVVWFVLFNKRNVKLCAPAAESKTQHPKHPSGAV
jgi:hypothetical protein